MRRIKTYGIAALVILFLVVVIQNVGAVDIRFLAWKFSLSQALLLPLVLIVGFLIGYLYSGLSKK